MAKVRRGIGRMQFLAHKQEIASRLAKGEPIKSIFQALHGEEKISIGYRQFVKYVNTVVKNEIEDDPLANPKKDDANKRKKPVPSDNKKGKVVSLDFKGAESESIHNPKANTDELI